MSKEPKKIFNDDDPQTYNPRTKIHGDHRIMVNINSGDITVIGKTPPDHFIPAGWIQTASNRYVPTWPVCKFRRLNVLLEVNTPPKIDAVCVHPEIGIKKGNSITGTDVDHDICKVCKLFQVIETKPILTADEKVKVFKRKYRNDLSDLPEGIKPPEIYDARNESKYWDKIEEGIFQEEMAELPPEHPGNAKNARRIHQKWKVSCIHRYQEAKDDCSGCGNIMCNNPDAERFGLQIMRKDCKACLVAETALQALKKRI